MIGSPSLVSHPSSVHTTTLPRSPPAVALRRLALRCHHHLLRSGFHALK